MPNLASLSVSTPDVNARSFGKSFCELPLDPYLKEAYRFRAVSRFSCSGHLEKLEREPLFQDTTYNPIPGFGGVERHYPELSPEILELADFGKLVSCFQSAIPDRLNTLSVHQIRTKAPGAPVPEGKHRDGNDWVGIYVVNREGIVDSSGLTIIWDESNRMIYRGVLGIGTLVVFDDRVTYHYTSEVNPIGSVGYRDVFIFSSPDHSHYLKR